MVGHSTRKRKALHELLRKLALGIRVPFEDMRSGERKALVTRKLQELSEDLQKRAQYCDQYSELDDEITSPLSYFQSSTENWYYSVVTMVQALNSCDPDI